MKKLIYLWSAVPTAEIHNVVLNKATDKNEKLSQYFERAGKGATEIWFINSASNQSRANEIPEYPDANKAIAKALPKLPKGARVKVDNRYMSFAEAAKLKLEAFAPTNGMSATNYWKRTSWMTSKTAEKLNDRTLERFAPEQAKPKKQKAKPATKKFSRDF